MKKKKSLMLLISIIFSVFIIYRLSITDQINYIALGDSLAEGKNPYGEISYGYPDFVAESLKEKDKLKSYTKKYTKSGYQTEDIIQQLNNYNDIKKDLRESELTTISIGANDFLNHIDKRNLNINDISSYKFIIDGIIPDLDNCLKEVRKYAKNKLIIVGYYNPIPFLFNTSEKDLDQLFSYIDDKYNTLAKKYKATYISNYQLFKKNRDFLPNPADIHPNIDGYKAIAKEILKKIK